MDLTFNLRLTAQQRTRVILLTRGNQLQRLLSLEIAVQTRIWQPENIARARHRATARTLSPLDPASAPGRYRKVPLWLGHAICSTQPFPR